MKIKDDHELAAYLRQKLIDAEKCWNCDRKITSKQIKCRNCGEENPDYANWRINLICLAHENSSR